MFKVSTTVATLRVYSVKDSCVNVELVWAFKMVESGHSGCLVDRVANVFGKMSPVPKNLSMGRTKFEYLLTEAVCPHFRQMA